MADGVSIDTGQVKAAAEQIREDTGTYFAAGADQGRDLHGQGVMFGTRYPGGAVVQAKQKYAEALSILDANLRNYQIGAELYAEAVERIAHAFAEVDQRSAAGQDAILEILRESAVVVSKKYGIPIGGMTAPQAASDAGQSAAQAPSKYAGGVL